jgi:lipid-binding SYLF domain-containing protein
MNSILARTIGLVLIVSCVQLVGCKSPQGATPSEKRADVKRERNEVLDKLYAAKPGLEERVNRAPGYAVFSNFKMKIFVVGSGNGFGVVHNNKTGRDTYMRMGELNVGFGLGGRDFRALFIFNNEQVMDDFINSGWEFGGDAEAGAAVEQEGAELATAPSVLDIEIYQYTETGVTLSATVGGTKFWKDPDLN